MAHASLRRLRVAIYAYQATATDPTTGVTLSVYVRQRSAAADGLWWASRGIVFGAEKAPAMQPQQEDTSFWAIDKRVPITGDSLIVEGTFPNGVFSLVGKKVYRVQAVMDRSLYRDEVQVYVTHVDDADATFVLEEPGAAGAFSSGFSSGFA